MPPRKRKAQQALAAINEEEPEARATGQSEAPNEEEVAGPGTAGGSDDQRVRDIIAEYKEQVEAKAMSLIDAARQRVQHLRTDAELAIIKLTKQVRSTTAAEFFKLGPEEAAATTLSSVLQRLQRLHQCGEGMQPQEAEAAGVIASALASVAPGGALLAGAPPPQQEQQPRQPSTTACPDDGSGPCSSSAQAAALMPPPPPRAALAPINSSARAPMANEVVYSANGSPIYLNTIASSSAAHGTTTKGAVPGIVDATPAVGASCAAAAPQPQTVAFTGQTFRRATAARGRTKQATRAITVTTADGKTFTVDDVIGLAAVPDKYREEVRVLMESDLRDLDALYKSVATMEQANVAAAAGTTTGATRPTRRR